MQFHIDAAAAGREMEIWLPDEEIKEDLPVIWALHGMFQDAGAWLRESSLMKELHGMQVCVVCPDGGNTFYTDCPDGESCESNLMEKAWMYVYNSLPVSHKRADTAVIGFSMGGYGAMRFGLRYPQRFGTVGCFAGGVNLPQRYAGGEDIMGLLGKCFGPADSVVGSEYDLFLQAKQLADAGTKKPVIRMCVGYRDPHENGPNQEFRDYLRGLGFTVHWNEGDYDHNWEFVNAMLPGFLQGWCADMKE